MEDPALQEIQNQDITLSRWRRTLWTSWFAQIFSITAFAMVMPFMPFYIRELGVTDEHQIAMWAGVTITGSGLMFTFFAPFWGILSDRIGRKIMVERAMFGGMVVLFCMGLVHNVYQLVAMRMLQGVLTGTISASIVLVSSVTPRDRLAWSLGLMQTAVLTGNSLGPWLGGALADHFGYRVPFFVSSGLLFLGGLAVLIFIRENFVPVSRGQRQKTGLRKAFGVKGLIAILSVFFFINFAGSFVAPIFPLFVEKIAGSSSRIATITGMLMAVTGIAAGVSAMLVGRWSDNFGHRRLLFYTTFFSGLATVPQAFVQNINQLFGLRVAGGFAAGGTSPVMNAIIGNTAPPEIYGRAYGVTQAASALGWAIGPLAGAWLSGIIGFRWPFVIMGGMLFLTSILVISYLPKDVRVNGPDENGNIEE